MWGQIAAAVAPSLIGGLLGGKGASEAARGAGEASQMQQDAANKAYEGGTYKPYGVTSGLGKSSFDGQNMSFQMDPRYQQQQGQMMGLGSQAFQNAGGDYQSMADNFYNQQRALGAGSRNAEALSLGGSMFGSGRTGLQMSNASQGFGANTEGTSNPDANMFMNSFLQQDAQDRFNSQNMAQQQRQRELDIGNSMFNQSMMLDQAGVSQGMQGAQLGQYRSGANNAAGSNLVSGMGGAGTMRGNQGLARGGMFTGMGNAIGTAGQTAFDMMYPSPVGTGTLNTGAQPSAGFNFNFPT
tara:strand:- start:611 stop:1501 length:891 start_codon:yes stop_codon:yes gene_type:complete